jgi:hypothetical protein
MFFRKLYFCLTLACLVLLLSAVAAAQQECPDPEYDWVYEDLITLDVFQDTRCSQEFVGGELVEDRCGWGESHGGGTLDVGLDIVALYSQLENGELRLRIDLLDAPEGLSGDLYVAFGTENGTDQFTADGLNLETDFQWDRVVRWSSEGAVAIWAKSGRLSENSVSGLYNPCLDFLELSLPASVVPQYSEAPTRVRAFRVANNTVVDSTPVGEYFQGQAKLVLNLGNALTATGPGAEGNYHGDQEFEDLCLEPDSEGSRTREGGARYLLEAIEKYKVPVVLPDVQMEMLPGLEYLGANDPLRDLEPQGLVDLPDNLSFGYFMPWQHQDVDEKAIQMMTEIRRDLLGLSDEQPRKRVFYAAENLLKVEDLRTLAEQGYRGILGGEYYAEWFNDHLEQEKYESDANALYARLKKPRKVQDVKVNVVEGNPVSMKVFFQLEQQGIDTDERWEAHKYDSDPTDDVPGNVWDLCFATSKDLPGASDCAACEDLHWVTFTGTDNGLHLYWRRALLDYAVAEDQHQLFQINADIRLTPMVFGDVAERNLRWIAAHPWIRTVTYSQVLKEIEAGGEGESWLDGSPAEHPSVQDPYSETDLLPNYPRCGEDEDYNTYFRYFYDGEMEMDTLYRWDCFTSSNQAIEGFAPYEPPHAGGWRMGGYCPPSDPEEPTSACGEDRGPGCKEGGCQETIIHKTVSALLNAPDNELADLAWMHYFVTIEGQTSYVPGAEDSNKPIARSLPDGSPCNDCEESEEHELGGGKLDEWSRLHANFVGNANKIVAAAHWAACRADADSSSCMAVEDCGFTSNETQACTLDLDFDGEDEYILQNGQVFAVFENDGGRLQYAFLYNKDTGPIQLVAPLSQHFGLITPKLCCGPDCSADSACSENGERPLEGLEMGPFAEVLHTPVECADAENCTAEEQEASEQELYRADFQFSPSSSCSGEHPIGFRYEDAQGRMVIKCFHLVGNTITARYKLTGLGESDSLQFFFGLPVDMAGMYRRGSEHLVQKTEEETAVSWNTGRAAARVRWGSDQYLMDAHSFVEPADPENGIPVLKYPYNTVLLQGDQPFPDAFEISLELIPIPPAANTVLALDFSGSMNERACPEDGCEPKHEVLKDAVEIFVELHGELGGGQLGVVTFSNDAFVFKKLMRLTGHADRQTLLEDLRKENPDGYTAMGAGLVTALELFPEELKGPRGVILFTDGMQNVNPMVMPGNPLKIAKDPTIQRQAESINENISLELKTDVPIRTIGVGATGDYAGLLQDIAEATSLNSGWTNTTLNPSVDLRQFFVEALVDTLRDSSPQLVDYRRGTLAKSQDEEETFTVNRSARKVVFKLSWDRGAQPLNFQVMKNGRDLTDRGRMIGDEKDFYRIFALDLPVEIEGVEIVAEGEWALRLQGEGRYELAALIDEDGLSYDVSLQRSTLRVGQAIQPRVRLAVDGQPLTGARVLARVLGPKVSIGTALSEADTPDLGSASAEPGASDGQKKFQLLQQDRTFWNRIQPVEKADWFALRDRGDGTYTGEFRETQVPGAYRVEVILEGSHPTVGAFRREESRTAFVRFEAPEFNLSKFRLIWPERPTDLDPILIELRPRDIYGNYLGPDFGHRIHVEPPRESGTVGPVEDLLDGRYQVPLFGVSRDDDIRVQVLDTVLFEDALSTLPATDDRFTLAFHVGWSDPVSSFPTGADGDFVGEVSLEYDLRPRLSLVGVVGHYGFDPVPDVVGGSVYLRGYRALGQNRLFGEIGGGWFDPERLDGAAGLGLGAGVTRSFGTHWQWEWGARFHHLFNTGDDLEFVTVHAGIGYSF